MKQYEEKRAVVIGLGKSGCSAVEFLLSRGASVYGVDDNPFHVAENQKVKALIQRGLVVTQKVSDEIFRSIDLAVCSPGVPPSHPLIQQSLKNGIEVIGEMELACRNIDCCCIGITGTNGKTTLTLMLEHILRSCGRKAKAVGNVGNPITTEAFDRDYDTLVIEMSSYQLETLQAKALDLAVLMNITPDHLDRYTSIDDYISAKFRILDVLKADGTCFIHESVIPLAPSKAKDVRVKSYGSSSDNALYIEKGAFHYGAEEALPITPWGDSLSSHDMENMLAAYGIGKQLGVDDFQFVHAMSTFKKPPHRIEFVRNIDGVTYFNDSKGTNVDAVLKAVASMQGKVILIAGGVDKGSSFTTWLQKFPEKVKCICAIGEASRKIEQEVGHAIPVAIYSDLSKAVTGATAISNHGDSVLLSPGCASFDMFHNYEHRGDEFKRIVEELVAGGH